jgi:hypothetical protein
MFIQIVVVLFIVIWVSGRQLWLAFTDSWVLCKLPNMVRHTPLLSSNTSTCMLKCISILSFLIHYVSLFYWDEEVEEEDEKKNKTKSVLAVSFNSLLDFTVLVFITFF